MVLIIITSILTILTLVGILIYRNRRIKRNQNEFHYWESAEELYNRNKQPDRYGMFHYWKDLSGEEKNIYKEQMQNENNETRQKEKVYKRKNTIKTLLSSLLSLCWLILLPFGTFCKVSANEVGIIYDDRYGVLETVKYEGFQAKSLFEHITTISTTNRSAKLETTGQTSDGQYATFELSLIYRIDRENAGRFYKVTSSNNIPEEALNTIVKSSLQSSTIKYDIFELLSTKLEIARIDFKEDLAQELLEKYFLTLVDVSFDDVDAGNDVEQILQQKAEALQRIEIAERQAQADLITAENKAQIEKTLAEAEAYAIKTVGSARGEAENAYVEKVKAMIDNLYENSQNTLTYKECTDIVLGIIFYDTWNGELPEVLTSDSLSALIGSLIN